jgi:2-keto-3-deoxy-L-fuconate dehydrogenase
MADRLRNKTIFMTAAGRGIGRATAVAFAREGANLIATSLTPSSLESLAAEVPSITTRILDVRDADAIRRAADDVGPVDVLFNCAGWVHHGTVLDCDDAAWAASFDTNVTPMYRTIRAFLPAMLAAGRGNIINMASVVSSITGAVNRFAYGATKGAVLGLTNLPNRSPAISSVRAFARTRSARERSNRPRSASGWPPKAITSRPARPFLPASRWAAWGPAKK